MKDARKSYKKILLLFFLYTIVFSVLVGVSFVLPLNDNYKMLIAMLLLVILLVGMFFFRPRLSYYKENLMFHRLLENKTKPLPLKESPCSSYFLDKLLDNGYIKSFDSQSFSILTKHVRDKKEWILKRPMLFVFVAIYDDKLDFQDPSIIKQINLIEDSYYKEKKRIFNYTVFVAKEGSKMTKKEQESYENVSFSRVGKRSIVTINLFYNTKNKSISFLHSETYAPNSYYRYAVDLLKEYIK